MRAAARGSRRHERLAGAAALPLLIAALAGGCDDGPPPGASYFDERIGPIMEFGCVEQTAGCHLANDIGEATGNLDLGSFDALMRRADVLPAYGPYPVGVLLLKGGPDVDISVETWDPPAGSVERVVPMTTDIRHNAGGRVAIDSRDYARLKQWIEAGFARNGLPSGELVSNAGACRNGVGAGVGYEGFDPRALPGPASAYERFRDEVQPVIRETCAGSACHGSRIADLYYACGDDEDEVRWNYWVSVQHLTTPVSSSELLRRPLAQLRSGVFHEGGDVFESAEDPRYRVLREWAEALLAADPGVVLDPDPDPGLRFFANRVQPVLVRKGCMFLNCHSLAMFHDLRLRGGSQGVFSRVATRRNYEMSRRLLAYDSPSPHDARIIAKNLYPDTQVEGALGLDHRGGFLFEDFGSAGGALELASPDDCAGFDADDGDLSEVPAYCIMLRWHEIEREEAIARGEIAPEPVTGVVWVSRPVGSGDILDFDTFRGGADLRFADATVDAAGAITLGGDRSLLAGCGLTGDLDVRTPAVSWDGGRIAFAARAAGAPLRLYWMAADGSGCEPVPAVAPALAMENGILTHDFDPAFAPDGRLVFASTRGYAPGAFPYAGPQRTPAALQPNANLYVREEGGVRQLTFLLDQELAPSFMGDGRVIFTTEKAEAEFHQLAGRRQNLDGGDYHPLFAQRASLGFDAATEFVELRNRNLAFVASQIGATDGAGAVAIANRSIGPDQSDRDPGDRAYIHSLLMPIPGALGGMSGAFRSPAAIPGGRILASCDPMASTLTGTPFAFQLCEIDPVAGTVRAVGGDAGRANVEAAIVGSRANEGVFASRIDEANGHTEIVPGRTDAIVKFQDFPLLGTLLFSNTREGRPIDPRIGGFEVLEALPPPLELTALDGVYANYRSLGWSPLYADGSAMIRIPGGAPIVLRVTDASGDALRFAAGAPFTGEVRQREQMQFYPGERSNQSLQRRFFNGLCGGCHGSISGRELDVAVDVDVLTTASRTLAHDADDPVDMMR